jgi:signal transduction histidine kinase
MKNIFDPFYTSKDVGKGSGLGLFIVHDIVESHGGTISVDSRLNEGTTFIIWLPGGAYTNE